MRCLRPLRVLKPFSRVSSTSPLCISRRLSIYPRSIINQEPNSFPPVFRLLDEFDRFSRSIDHPLRTQLQSFTPKFNVKETPHAYELQGEFPGIDQKNIEIELTDSSTLAIKGFTERIAQSSSDSNENNASTSHVKRIETSDATSDPDSNNRDSLITSEESSRQAQEDSDEEPAVKYLVLERNYGEFSRSFTFPDQVDENNVSAQMNNGILSITVPKLKKQPGRKINIK